MSDPALHPAKKNILIGLHGPAGSGKDTVADYLVNSWFFGKMAFAGPLKDACSRLWGVERDVFENPQAKEVVVDHWGVSPRHMAQWLGTEVMRQQFDIDFFLKRAAYTLDQDTAPRCMVVTDVRFDNEAEFIKSRGGQVWQIDAGNRIAQLDGRASQHASEKPIDMKYIDCVVDNSGDVFTTFQEVDNHLHGMEDF